MASNFMSPTQHGAHEIQLPEDVILDDAFDDSDPMSVFLDHSTFMRRGPKRKLPS